MILERSFSLDLPGTTHDLFHPEQVFAGRGPFDTLSLQADHLEGILVAEAPLIGEIQMPFESRLIPLGEDRARLEALPLGPPPAFWAELSGEGEARDGKLHYRLHLRLHAALPQGEKWGGKALRKMAEAAFERQMGRAIQSLEG
jgi:hypothetical protein